MAPSQPHFRTLEDMRVDLSDYAAEWKWDGIRVQIVGTGGAVKLYSRGGEEISDAFPDIAGAFDADAVVDGELLVRGDVQGGQAASFNALQQRLGRKTVTAKMLRDSPAFVRLYDILIEGDDDLRPLPWSERRERLEAFVPRLDQSRFDISQLIPSDSYDDLAEVRDGARDAAIEGVMLKRKEQLDRENIIDDAIGFVKDLPMIAKAALASESAATSSPTAKKSDRTPCTLQTGDPFGGSGSNAPLSRMLTSTCGWCQVSCRAATSTLSKK